VLFPEGVNTTFRHTFPTLRPETLVDRSGSQQA
jgi:hypothetical protein